MVQLNSRLLMNLGVACTVFTPACKQREVMDRSGVLAADSQGVDGSHPWQIHGPHGESYLPDIFYADPSQNEQVMPLAPAGSKPQIDRLIYPTIGNPNLYIKDDTNGALTWVLRLELPIFSQLTLTAGDAGADTSDKPTGSGGADGLTFFLVSHKGRQAGGEGGQAIGDTAIDGKEIIRLSPTTVTTVPLDDAMPAVFKKRRTISVVFGPDAMQAVAAGLYDVRLEIRKGGQLVQDESGQGVFETQFNAVRVFDHGPESGQYSIVNVTDTQVTIGKSMRGKTLDKLQEFVTYLNGSSEPEIQRAAFMTFNGDLHNGGTPDNLLSGDVATDYMNEAQAIIAILKQLNLPIFLTVGNHDGYVATGQVPSMIAAKERRIGPDLQSVVQHAGTSAWPDFKWENYQSYLDSIADLPGGKHLDLFSGRFEQHAKGASWADSWTELADADRNMILYDGRYQWQRTYGPAYFSWTFGKNLYVSMNSFDLRQHRRTGWGMYTVNYGGNISPTQMEWITEELARGEAAGQDIVLLAHHDPRGGHNGSDFPYYFAQVDYNGMGLSAENYVNGEYVLPEICGKAPGWAKSDAVTLDCMHDGLQEWMRPDPEFDCEDDQRTAAGICDLKIFQPGADPTQRKHLWYSGYQLIEKMSTTPHLRTVLLGHTHYASYEMLQEGDELVPGRVILDAVTQKRLAATEVINPLRGLARLKASVTHSNQQPVFSAETLAQSGVVQENKEFILNFDSAGYKFNRHMAGASRELAIMRMTSNADLTTQKYGKSNYFGFTTFEILNKQDARSYDLPQINRVNFYINRGSGSFDKVKSIDLDRTSRVVGQDKANPVNQTFTMP